MEEQMRQIKIPQYSVNIQSQLSVLSNGSDWGEIVKEQSWSQAGQMIVENNLSEQNLRQKEQEVLSLVAQNRSKLHCVERELKQIDKQRRMAQGNSKQLMEFLRKKLESQTEKVVIKRQKVQAVYKLYAKAQEELQKEEKLKEQLCDELNGVVQQQALAHMQRLDQLEKHIKKINLKSKSIKKNSKSSPMISDLAKQNSTNSNGKESQSNESELESSDTTFLKRQSSFPYQSREKSARIQEKQKSIEKNKNNIFDKFETKKLKEVQITRDLEEHKVHGGQLSRSQQDLLSLNYPIKSQSHTQLQKLDGGLSSQKKSNRSFVNLLENDDSNTFLSAGGSSVIKGENNNGGIYSQNKEQSVSFESSLEALNEDQSLQGVSPYKKQQQKYDTYLDWDQQEEGGWDEDDEGGWDLDDNDLQDTNQQNQQDNESTQHANKSSQILNQQYNDSLSNDEQKDLQRDSQPINSSSLQQNDKAQRQNMKLEKEL